MKNKTTYSKLVSLKKKFFKKQFFSANTAMILDNFFNNFHNIIIQLKERFTDNVIHVKDISKDKLIQCKDKSKDFLINKADLIEKNIKKTSRKSISSLFSEMIQVAFLNLYYEKWNVTEQTDQAAVKNIRKIIVNSANVSARVQKYYDRESVTIYPPTETDKIMFKQNGDFWLSVNRLTTEKRIELQIEAFKRLPNKTLIIIGGYDVENNYARSLLKNKPENVLFIQNVTEDELRSYYANCKAFITTARDEDFGMTVVEAMAAGKAIIAPNEGGYKETVLKEENGILINEISSEKIIDAVNTIERNIDSNDEYYIKKCTDRSKSFSAQIFSNNLNNFLSNMFYFEKDKQIIFIVGIPRSGTTWMWGLLNSHPDVCSLTKSDFDKTSKNIETNMLFDNNLKEISSVLKSKNSKFIVEKTPDHLMKIERIKNEFPYAKIIYMTRNPFSIYSSYKNSEWDKKNIPVEVWLKLYLERIIFYILNRDYINMYTLKYEDLNSKPEATLSKLFDFLNLDKTKIDYIVRDNHLVSKSVGAHGIRKAENNSWILELNPFEKDFINYYTKSLRSIKSTIVIPSTERVKLFLSSLSSTRSCAEKQLIFIVGVPRSGTTWLWNLLSENPYTHTLTADDFRFFKKNNSNFKEESNALFDHDINKIKSVIRGVRKNIIIEKTPMHVTQIQKITNNFPNAKILNIVRDPVSVYASYKFTSHARWRYKDMKVEEWVKLYKNIFSQFQNYLNHENIHTTTYEQLLEDPKRELIKICKFAKLQYDFIDSAILKYEFEKWFPVINKKRGVNTLSKNLSEKEISYIKDNLKDEINILKKYYE